MFRWGQASVLGLVMAALIATIAYLSTFDIFRTVDKGMLGALIGAAGAIFAGWLIWAQARDQIQANQRAQLENEERQEQFQIQALVSEIAYIRSAAKYLDRFILPFDGAQDNGSDYRVRLFEMNNRGELIFPHLASNQVPAVSNSLLATFNRMQNLVNSIFQAAGALDANARYATVDEATKANVEEMRTLRRSLDDAIGSRETKIERLKYE